MATESVLVDTTHWIAFFGGGDALGRKAVALLLARGRALSCPVVTTEVLRGFAREGEADDAAGVLRRCGFRAETRGVAERAGWLGRRKRVVREGIPTSDLLIAALSQEEDVPILTSDPHFRSIPGCRLLRSDEVLRSVS